VACLFDELRSPASISTRSTRRSSRPIKKAKDDAEIQKVFEELNAFNQSLNKEKKR